MSQEKASTRKGDLLTPWASKKTRGSSERRILLSELCGKAEGTSGPRALTRSPELQIPD
jgi:hypothetical protein